MGYVKNLVLFIVIVAICGYGVARFGLIETKQVHQSASEIYGVEYSQVMGRLKEINQKMSDAESALQKLSTERAEVIARGDDLIKDSFEWAHTLPSGTTPTAEIEPMTGDVDVGLYD